MKTLQDLILLGMLGASLPALLAAGQTRFATLFTFTDGGPTGLTLGSGVLYGASQGPGPDCGTVFELQPPAGPGGGWTQTVLHTFAAMNDACYVFGPVRRPGGALYGLGYQGGAYGSGAMFELQPPTSPGGAWTESLPYSFGAPGTYPGGAGSALVPAPDGSFYLLATAGAYGYGALFHLQPPPAPGEAWSGTVVYSFPPSYAGPDSLIAGPGGTFYGTISTGGSAHKQLGEVFQLTPPAAPGRAWTETVLHNFGYGGYGGDHACNPNSLTLATSGALYGTTYGFSLTGASGAGVVFELTPPPSPGGSWTYKVLKDFGSNHPDAPLVLRNGNLYGALATPQGGAVFELQPPSTPGGAWTTTYLHQFTNGQTPTYSLLMSRDGTLYGMTQSFAQPASGTIFAIATQ